MLADTTNEEVVFSQMRDPRDGTKAVLTLDEDYDSSLDPSCRVVGMLVFYDTYLRSDNEVALTLTYEEAYKVWDRLGRILALDTIPELEVDAG